MSASLDEAAAAKLLHSALTGATPVIAAASYLLGVLEQNAGKSITSPPPSPHVALLDALLRLAHDNSESAYSFLFIVIYLCTTSSHAWSELEAAQVPATFPQTDFVLMQIVLSQPLSMPKSIPNSLVTAATTRARKLLHILCSRVVSAALSDTNDATLQAQHARALAHILEPAHWDTLGSDSFASAATTIATRDPTLLTDAPFFERRVIIFRSFTRPTPALAAILDIMPNYPALQGLSATQHSLLAEMRLANSETAREGGHTNSNDVAEGDSALPTTPASAYALARQGQSSLATALRTWRSKKSYHLLAAAYIACPDKLRSLPEKLPAVAEALCALPPWLRAHPQDDILDSSLVALLAAIPQLRRIYTSPGAPPPQSSRAAALALRRLALAHPALARRRAKDIVAAAQVVLTGLEGVDARYGPAALLALEAFFVALVEISDVSAVAGSTHSVAAVVAEVGDIALQAVYMLLDEGREGNGIPTTFSAVASLILRVLAKCPGGTQDTLRARKRLQATAEKSGTADDIRNSIEKFLKTSAVLWKVRQ